MPLSRYRFITWPRGASIKAHVAFAAICLLASGCARYERHPLDVTAQMAPRAADLAGSRGSLVTMQTLDRLVLANNPDLRAARAKIGVGEAQVIVAGILPNPQVAAAYPFLVSGPATFNSYSAGFTQDLRSILIRPTKEAAARDAAASVNASLIWQEWQTIGKARLLFVDIISGERTLKYIVQSRKLLRSRYTLTSNAIAQGNATLATLSPDLVAVGDIRRTHDDLARLQLNRRHQLATLIGLTPDAPLALAGDTPVPHFDPKIVRQQLATLGNRRPDLVALQFGYRSQDAKVRQAILSQFPNVAVGLFAGQDTSNVLAIGPQLTMELPIFDRNQGGVALESSTREQLREEFAARLTSSTAEIMSLLSEQELLRKQIVGLEPQLREARTIAGRTEAAFKQGTFDERAYVDIESARLAREQEKIALEQALLEGQVGLATLVGAGFPPVVLPPETPPSNPLGLLREVVR